jgi:hypothetical protein
MEFVPHKKQITCPLYKRSLELFRDMNAVYWRKGKKHMNTRCGEKCLIFHVSTYDACILLLYDNINISGFITLKRE